MASSDKSEGSRPSALKNTHVDPLGGSPVQLPPGKVQRIGDGINMEEDVLGGGAGAVFPAVPAFPGQVGSFGDSAPPSGLVGSGGGGCGPTGSGPSSGPPGPGTGPPGSGPGAGFADDDMSMKALILEMRGMRSEVTSMRTEVSSMNTNMNSRFSGLSIELNNLKTELSNLKLEMVTKAQFEELEGRISLLEQNVVSPQNPNVKFLQDQLDRLDPARKCLSFVGFRNEDAGAREVLIKAFFQEKLSDLNPKFSFDHIRSGPPQNRKFTGVSLLEFSNTAERDDAMRLIEHKKCVLFDGSSEIKIRFAKTRKQMRRNWAMNKALELLKAEPLATNKQVEADWKVAGNRGHRSVKVDGVVAFDQNASDLSGDFKNNFVHLALP